jgi:hypothetical protein
MNDIDAFTVGFFVSSFRGYAMQTGKSRDLADRIRWLAAHGCPVEIPESKSNIKIERSTESDDITQIFDLPGGLAGYIFDVKILNAGFTSCYIRELEFIMCWSDSRFRWLEDPRERDGRYKKLYGFPGTSIEYDIGMVLNHVLIPGAVLRPNYPHLGLLLAVGDPIPPAVRHGSSVTGMLNIFVEGADAGSCQFDLRVDRSSRARGRETRQTLVRHNSHNDVLDLPASCDIKKDGVGATKSGIH